jgi:hypothetical protein
MKSGSYWLAAAVGLGLLVRLFGADLVSGIHDLGLRFIAIAVVMALFGIALGFVLIANKEHQDH